MSSLAQEALEKFTQEHTQGELSGEELQNRYSDVVDGTAELSRAAITLLPSGSISDYMGEDYTKQIVRLLTKDGMASLDERR